jgi:hypothetical protein
MFNMDQRLYTFTVVFENMSEEAKRFQLLGICGVYCGACTTYRAYNDGDDELVDWEIKMGMPRGEIICKGCRSGFVNKWCSECKFRKCVKDRGVNNCFDCQLFPCKTLVDFSRTRPHRQLGLRNLVQVKSGNIEGWLRQQEKRWSCPSCGKKLHWYAENCPKCGTRFFNAADEVARINQP